MIPPVKALNAYQGDDDDGAGYKEVRNLENKYKECLKVLIANPKYLGVQHFINRRDVFGNTPLHSAVKKWPEETVQALLKLGANISLTNLWGEVPLTKIEPDNLKHFLDHSCMVAVDQDGRTVHENQVDWNMEDTDIV